MTVSDGRCEWMGHALTKCESMMMSAYCQAGIALQKKLPNRTLTVILMSKLQPFTFLRGVILLSFYPFASLPLLLIIHTFTFGCEFVFLSGCRQ